MWRNSIYSPASLGQAADQLGKRYEIPEAECRTPGRDLHEGIPRNRIGPARRQRAELPHLVQEVDALLTPRVPVVEELELALVERVVGVGHPNPSHSVR